MNSLSFGRALMLSGLMLLIAVMSYYVGLKSGSAPALPVIP